MSVNAKTILCVDDDTDDLSMISDAIKEADASLKVVEARNGIQAIRYLEQAKEKKHLPGLIVMDVNMPMMDGKQTLLKIKNHPEFKKIPVVIFTTSSNGLDQFYFATRGVEMVTKPSSIKEINIVIKQLLHYYN